MKENGMNIWEASPQLKKELSGVADKMLTEYLKDANSSTKKIFEEYRK